MNGTSTGPVKCAIWARVSTTDQHTENQLHVLREWAERRGYEVVREFIVEDSAWAVSKGNGNGTKGREFEKAREELLQGAHHGHYRAVLIWALDRLSRRGYDDLSPVMQQLRASQCDLLSHQEQWLTSLGPFGEVVIHMLSLWANQESERRSERIKAGMATRRRNLEAGVEVKGEQRIGGRKAGSRDRRRRSREGYEAAWEPGGPLYEARQQRLAAQRAELLADPVRLRDLRRDVPCEECGAGIADPCRRLKGKHKGATLSLRDMHTSRKEASDRALQVAQVSAIVSEAAESAAQAEGSGEEQAG